MTIQDLSRLVSNAGRVTMTKDTPSEKVIHVSKTGAECDIKIYSRAQMRFEKKVPSIESYIEVEIWTPNTSEAMGSVVINKNERDTLDVLSETVQTAIKRNKARASKELEALMQ